tara:strand:+ start:8453 stop:9172 length:720 start_codon:yes stop_codon:yes gene_type:complete
MKILIPLAGAGSRFFKAGYKDPKPLIDVSGKPMIQRIIENIGLEQNEHVFIVQKAHMQKYPHMKKYLQKCVSNSIVVEIDKLTEGAACTTLLAKEFINDDSPLFIANADQWVDWNPKHFQNYCKEYDGCIPYFLSDSPKHSYSRINYDTGNITQVAEKQVISNFATVGMYYWAKGSEYVSCAEEMISKNIRFNNEFYICPVYNILINSRGGVVKPYPVYEMRGMGTPEELDRFLAKLEK